MEHTPLSYIELSQKNLEHNFSVFRSLAKPGTEFAFAVKGNAYGHGLSEIVTMAENCVDYFFINSIEELRIVRAHSKKTTFLFGYVAHNDLTEALKLGCVLSVGSTKKFLEIKKCAEDLGVVQDIHIVCDAYLGREGFQEEELAAFFATAKNAVAVNIAGIYAHFANIEDTTDFTHAQKQIDAYARMQKIAEDAGFTNLKTHLSSTSGLLVYEKDLGINPIIRIGIGGYGLWPNERLERQYKKKEIELAPVLSWKTHIAQVKKLAVGLTVGYGLTYKTQKETLAAVIPQGYADGFSRALSNCGMVLIGGRRCAVIGRVSMNMFVVDATNVPDAAEGDEVVLIGEQGDKSLTATEAAERSDTISYEFVTRISPLVPRFIV